MYDVVQTVTQWPIQDFPGAPTPVAAMFRKICMSKQRGGGDCAPLDPSMKQPKSSVITTHPHI